MEPGKSKNKNRNFTINDPRDLLLYKYFPLRSNFMQSQNVLEGVWPSAGIIHFYQSDEEIKVGLLEEFCLNIY